MKKIVCIVLCVAFLLSIVPVAINYHHNAIDVAYDEGYDEGYNKGHSKGYVEGHGDGYDRGYAIYEEIKDEYEFYHDYAVIVTKTGKRYHRYDCYHINNRNFYIYNISNAEAKGYTPCLDCFD